MEKNAEHIREGKSFMKEGDKSSTKGLFRKPDWDIASGCYKQAAVSFRSGKSFTQSVEAYKKAAEAFQKSLSPTLAGQALEDAAKVLEKDLNDKKKAALTFESASHLFNDSSPDRAADNLAKAARLWEDIDINKAMKCYKDAVEVMELAERGRLTSEHYKRATAVYIKYQRYEEAVDMLRRELNTLRENQSGFRYRYYLSIVIVVLAYHDIVLARDEFNAWCNEDDRFIDSNECKVCQAILDAYDHDSQTELKDAIACQSIHFLDYEVGRLAHRLNVTGVATLDSKPNITHGGNREQYTSKSTSQTANTYNKADTMSPSRQREELLGTKASPTTAYPMNHPGEDDEDDEDDLR